jgi:Phage major capsid protein E
MADLFSTNVLLGVVQSLFAPAQFLLNKFFPLVQSETSEQIHFDLISRTRRVAPFVSPLVSGQIVASQGFTTSTFTPAYVKDKRVWDGTRALKRSPGEQIGGSLTPMDRMRAILVNELQDQVQMIQRRLELMASEAVRTGKVTVTGEKYPTVVVDFLRAAGNTVTLTGGALWSASTAIPMLSNLHTWAVSVLKASGAYPLDVVMDIDAFTLFANSDEVKARLGLQRVLQTMPTMEEGAELKQGGVLMGTIDGFNVWVYADWYIDSSGVEQPILPSGTVIMGGPAIEGVQAFGAIRDEEAGYQAVPYYPKSWIEKDPAVRFMLMQSAPLVVPVRANASFCATVK